MLSFAFTCLSSPIFASNWALVWARVDAYGSETPVSLSLTLSLPPAAFDFSVAGMSCSTPMRRMISLMSSRSRSRSFFSSSCLVLIAARALTACLLAVSHFSYSLRANDAPSVASFAFSMVRRYVLSASIHVDKAAFHSLVTLPMVMFAASSSPPSFFSSWSNFSMMMSFFLHRRELSASAIPIPRPRLKSSDNICTRAPSGWIATSVDGLSCQAWSLLSISWSGIVAPCSRRCRAKWSSFWSGLSTASPVCCTSMAGADVDVNNATAPTIAKRIPVPTTAILAFLPAGEEPAEEPS
mmetsp:Transcript_34879/g.82171  ORF Transcript_34879/g.82171 Transcript_34879/m.82171 type:complete len:297 (+) Transcript_34879:751-1641(+)